VGGRLTGGVRHWLADLGGLTTAAVTLAQRDRTPAPTSAAASAGCMTPPLRPISASAIGSGIVVAVDQDLADGTGRKHKPPEFSSQHLVVLGDREQGAECGGGERQADRHVVANGACRPERR
jgi:hypothetical protein